MKLEVVTAARTFLVEAVASIRFDAPDGARGVLPGHEPARVVVEPGAVEFTLAGGERGVMATEGGLATIDPKQMSIATRWAAQADGIDRLRRTVAARAEFRAAAEVEARALAVRHEMATRRALASLRRQVPT